MAATPSRPLATGDVLWSPPPDWRTRFELGRFVEWLKTERGHDFADYQDLYRWSVSDLDAFWGAIWDFFEIRAHAPYERVLGSREMPGAEWFPGALINCAEHMVGRDEDAGSSAVVAHSQTRGPIELTFGDLREQVARARVGLQELGVQRGDRVVAYLPNVPETLVAFLAAASLGAVWATCPPEFGRGACSIAWASSSRQCCSPSPATGTATSSSTAASRWRRSRAGCRRSAPSSTCRMSAARTTCCPTRWRGTSCSPPAGRSRSTRCRSTHPLYVLFSSGTTACRSRSSTGTAASSSSI